MENPRKLDGRRATVNDHVRKMRNLWRDDVNKYQCKADVCSPTNGNIKRFDPLRQKKSMKYALEWLERLGPDMKDLKSGYAGYERVGEGQTCFAEPPRKSFTKANVAMPNYPARNSRKYPESMRKSGRVKNRLNEPFLRYWQPTPGREERGESRDIVPAESGKIFRYKEEHIELLSMKDMVVPEKQVSHRKKANMELCHPLLQPFLGEKRGLQNGQKAITVDGMTGEAVVIYRRNGHRRLDDWKNYQIEQFAFGKAKFGVSLDGSPKRSSSETREKAMGQICVTRRRRSKFHCEPVKLGRSVSIEFKKFDEMREMFHPDEARPVFRHDSAYFWKPSDVRLRSAAEKKLNLFKEMKKSERYRKKKFHETAARSLNYPCAVAENSSAQTLTGRETAVVAQEARVEEPPSPTASQDQKKKESSGAEVGEVRKENWKTTAEAPENVRQPKELSKQQALSKLRQILEELVTEDDANGDAVILEGGDQYKGDAGNRYILMSALGKDVPETCELENLMRKLKVTLNECKEILRPQEEGEREEKARGRAGKGSRSAEDPAGRNMPTVIAFPVSASKNIQTTQSSRRNGAPREWAWERIPDETMYVADDGKSRKSVGDVRQVDEPEGRGREMNVTVSERKGPPAGNNGSARVASETTVELESGKRAKSGKSSKSDKSWSERSVGTSASGSLRKSSPRTSLRSNLQRNNLARNRGQTNLGSTKTVEKKIMKLESRLKELLRRVGVCPNGDQASIRRCLEKLKETSEALLTRLRSHRLDYCRCDSPSPLGRAGEPAYRGYQSEPESAVKVNKGEKSLILKTSGSEIELNVGMEITMENFDPTTGQKLRPEENRDFEQEGTIKCKLMKPGEKPVTFIDTDFLYNPKTGMLFKGGSAPSKGPKGSDPPIKPTKTYLLSKTVEPPFPLKVGAGTAARMKPNFRELYRRDDSPVDLGSSSELKRANRGTSPPSRRSDAFRLAIDRHEVRNAKHLEDSRSRETSAARAGSQHSRGPAGCTRKPSLIPTAKFTLRPGSHGPGDANSTEKRTLEQAYHLKEIQLAKLFSYTWTFGFFICKLVYYMQSVSAICSVLTLTAMSVERYYAIVHPMRAQYVCTISQARRIISVTWISSLFLAIPVLFAQIHMPVGVRVKGFWCVRDYDNPTIWRAHETYMLLLILVIPTGVMGVAYTTICLEIWQVMQRRQDLTSAKILNIRYTKSSVNSDGFSTLGKEKRKQHRKTFTECGDDEAHVKQVIKMLVAVVVIYVVCWAPLLIDNILQAYDILPFMKFGQQKYMATAFHLMAYFNSCINPIVYGFMSKNFRESFHKTLCCRMRKGTASLRNPSVSHDRSTSIRYAESRSHQSVKVKSSFNGLSEEMGMVDYKCHGCPDEDICNNNAI